MIVEQLLVKTKHQFLPAVTPLSWRFWLSVSAAFNPGFAACEPFPGQTCCQMGVSGTSLLTAQSLVPLPALVALLTMVE